MKLNNDYIDSPVSLAIGILYAKEKGLEPEVIHNSNSYDFVVRKPLETASYFGIIYRE